VSAVEPGADAAAASLRLDKWLWYARFCKTRSLATKLCQSGQIRIAGSHVTKAHQPIRTGDVLTFPLGRAIRVVRILALGVRRGPVAEARRLYDDLTPPAAPPSAAATVAGREPGSGRPTKRERRKTDRLKGED
jgi:ribosome-associated heat shock protein Hsp15